MFYWIKTHRIVKKLFSYYVWEIFDTQKKVYLTFDDGPTPTITQWVLSELKKYNAKATFFCIGDNIEKHASIFKQILSENHAIGNHTYNHLNGWKTNTKTYIDNFHLCENTIRNAQLNSFDIALLEDNYYHKPIMNNSKTEDEMQQTQKLFRPPYGKIKPSQTAAIRSLGYKIIMWDVLSADFDNTISKEKCLENVLKNVKSGSIIIFHDSEKAFSNLEYALPKTLEFLHKKGFLCEVMS